jgi:Flp pilus assembly protein TadD
MKALRFGSAVSAVALAASLAGCAVPMAREGSALKSNPDLALALRAQMALGSGDFASAIGLAERAVENRAGDAALRTLLGNAYFGAGRFASAQSAYRDSLSLAPAQPQVVLKLALVEIAQGRRGEALALLESARGMIDPADHGLALALAGQPHEAVQLLDMAARALGADSRVRQNLALAHALAGDWTAARTIAEQDLAPGQVDQRIQQWMALARPARASDQLAALIGISPAASDPGQPVRLALNASPNRYAQAAPIAPQAPVVAPAPASQEIAVSPYYTAPEPAPVEVAAAEPAPAPPQPEPATPARKSSSMTFVDAMIAAEAPSALGALAPSEPVAAPKPSVAKAKPVPVRKAAMPVASGRSDAVVQLGAYGSPQRVQLAWQQLTSRYPALRSYTPLRARFAGPRGTVWRLSIKGFASQAEAVARCNQLRGRGGSCFVRTAAGDAPVQLASR